MNFGATRLGILLGAGLLGSAAGGVVLTTSIGGAMLCFGTASCLYAVFENERFAVVGAERVVADLVAYRDATAADVERFCGEKGVLALHGLAQRRDGVREDTFCRVVAEQLRAHAKAVPRTGTPQGVERGSVSQDKEPRRPVPTTLVPSQDEVEGASTGVEASTASKGTDGETTGQEVDEETTTHNTHAPARVRKGSASVRLVLSAQIATDLTELVQNVSADKSEVSSLFPLAKHA